MLTFISGSDTENVDNWIRESAAIVSTRQERAVRQIVQAVRHGGDEALFGYISENDGFDANADSVLVSQQEIEDAFAVVPAEVRRVLVQIAANLENYHKRQLRDDWFIERPDGSFTGMRHTPVEAAGICVAEGGEAASTVLMDIVPAKVAGVDNITACLPAPRGRVSALTLLAAHVAGANEILKISGAPAVAALAYGTDTVVRADVVVASGSTELMLAKRVLEGQAGVDILSGVPGITIIADEAASAELAASDILAQAACGAESRCALLTTSEDLARSVDKCLDRQLRMSPSPKTARAALRARGAAIVCEDMAQCCEISDRIAPDRLQIMTREPQKLLFDVHNAALILLGENSPPAVADYLAGVNHVLPTGGMAGFASPLSVDSFQKQTSLVYFSRAEMESTIEDAALFARAEGLEEHARSAELRRKGVENNA